MKNSRRTFFKQGLAGALALGSASLPVSAAAMTDGGGKVKAKRVVLISLDGICVEGFLKARTPNLDVLLVHLFGFTGRSSMASHIPPKLLLPR